MHVFAHHGAGMPWEAHGLDCQSSHRKRKVVQAHAQQNDNLDFREGNSEVQGLKAAFQLMTQHVEFGFDFGTQQKKPAAKTKPVMVR